MTTEQRCERIREQTRLIEAKLRAMEKAREELLAFEHELSKMEARRKRLAETVEATLKDYNATRAKLFELVAAPLDAVGLPG